MNGGTVATSYPKPDAERRNRVPPVFGWVNLPDVNPDETPPLPPLRDWTSETLRWWAELWLKGCATQWDQNGTSAVPMAVLYQDLQFAPPEKVAGILGELRQQEDRHGLNPKAMLQLRWRYLSASPLVEAAPAPAKRPASRRARVLQIIPDSHAG